jgi:hypothetical protein
MKLSALFFIVVCNSSLSIAARLDYGRMTTANAKPLAHWMPQAERSVRVGIELASLRATIRWTLPV